MQRGQNDAELVALASKGDVGSFEQLVNGHYQMVYAVAFRLTGNQQDAQDIAQDTFVRVAKSINRFRGDSTFKTWLYRITTNVAYDFHKKNARERQGKTDYSERLVSSEDDPTRSRQILDALSKLTPKERQAVILVLYEGYKHAEAAEMIGCAETTVSWRIHQAKKKLQRYFAREGLI